MTTSDRQWRKLERHARALAMGVSGIVLQSSSFDKEAVRSVLVAGASKCKKMPSILDIPELLRLKGVLESCDSICDIVGVLNANRSFIQSSVDLTDDDFDRTIAELWKL